ncbi:2-keto-4-pentenoate hydratase/2-oxohepta-3-ene-1,7-dioic acid hydratase in catechol pathway [Paraperlucidibaca baekdonensis]|uniref:2-keto-4-pentenoate hydratase/2-oxohepta-3-ene-1,7-dioic acid hydratase in catechol pathway n=1 Tax=Paraperlucidibaca baekdonensis TaxID=748120 RepID=A0A3E0H9S9_9GAMM|nr:fumarylacetoacetate hydrolase family protein [Paraperlucidibaca baekdonensis]REH40404.1 2-keto-4-pentenoate hydratase/2-oxohepta-3-ene-1,7-dioic acid hydratase in catechol pathway [Paraperlucidibaca baekdonensis]
MSYQWQAGGAVDMPVGKLVCVGRNYAAHARELGNDVPDAPIIFLKPSTAAVALMPEFALPVGRGECHYETEITLLMGQRLSATDGHDASPVSALQAREAIAGIGLGLDLTLRDLQNQLKAKGQPWELAKAFDGAAPLSPFLPIAADTDLAALTFSLDINGQRRQSGNSADMIADMIALLQFITRYITLLPGDVVMTGTPAGVAALHTGDELNLQLSEQASWHTRVR